MSSAVDLSQQLIAETVPPKTLNETIKDEHNSAEAITSILNGKDSHFYAALNIHEWCGLAAGMLPPYIKLNSSKVATGRKRIVLAVLEDEINKLGEMQVHLGRFFSSFKEAAEKLTNDDAKKAIQSFAEATEGKLNRDGLKNQIEILENLKVQIEAYEPTSDLENTVIESAQKLINNCVEYRKLSTF